MKKICNKFIIFTLFAIMFSLIGCAPKGDPVQVLNNYYENIKNGNPEGAYNTLCEQSKKNFLKEDFIKWQNTNKETAEFKDVKIEKLNEYKDKNMDGVKFKNAIEFNIIETIKDVYNNKEDKINYKRYVVNDNGNWKVYRGKENGKELISESLNHLAWMYIEGKGNKSKDLNQAATILNEALKYNKDNAGAYYGLASTYEDLERYDEAIDPANKYIEKSNDNNEKSDGYNVLGIIYEAKDNIDKSIECYNKAIQLNANNQYAKTNLKRVKKY